MFTVEIKVNGLLVSHIYGRNTARIAGDGDEFKYDYEYYEVNSRDIISGSVNHKRSKGIRKLITVILEDVEGVLDDPSSDL